MIHLNLTIQNPWDTTFKNVYCKAGQLSENKSWEVECYRSGIVISFSFEVTFRRDHGGLCIEFGFLGYTIGAQIYDNRHWDCEKNTWEKHDND
jgi:hypothetical protein